MCLNIKTYKCMVTNLTNMIIFNPNVVPRGSETHLQVGENLNKIS